MKRTLLLSATTFLLTSGFATNNATKKPTVKASEIYAPIGNTGQVISLLDLSRVKAKDVQRFTFKYVAESGNNAIVVGFNSALFLLLISQLPKLFLPLLQCQMAMHTFQLLTLHVSPFLQKSQP